MHRFPAAPTSHRSISYTDSACADATFNPVAMRDAFGPGFHSPVIFDRHLELATSATQRARGGTPTGRTTRPTGSSGA